MFMKRTIALAALATALQVSAQTPREGLADAADSMPSTAVVAPVLYAYTTLSSPETDIPVCWQVLVPEREVLLGEHNAKPWILRNFAPLAGAVLGGVLGGLILKHHATAIVARRWAVPVVAASGGAGFMVGPGGVAGFVAGGAIAQALHKPKLPITLVSAVGGALAGKLLWEKMFPPDVPSLPGGPDDDIPVEVFVRQKMCSTTPTVSHDQSAYRVGYRFNGQERVADLPYDPGEALLLNAAGNITGPARVRLD